MSVDLASQHLGHKKADGATVPMIAAMKKYGLLVAAGKDVRVSDDANTIFIFGEDAPESTSVIKRLAMLPALFEEVLVKFPDGLPSDANLRARLQTEWRFANQRAADNFIRALREAVAISSGDSLADDASVMDNEAKVTEEPPMTHMQETPLRTPSGVSTRPPSQFSSPPSGTQSRPWNLGGGTIMTVTIPNTLTPKNIEKLRKYVDALASEAAIAWDDDNEPSEEGDA
jgi:hypothetical protein